MSDTTPTGQDPAEPEQPNAEDVPPRRSRRRYFIQAAIAVVVIVAIVVVASVLIAGQNNTVAKAVSSGLLGPKNMASGGALIEGSSGKLVTVPTPAEKIGHVVPTKPLAGKANIVEYVDLQCPYCLEFEETNLNNVASWVQSGQATLEIHPIAFLDASSQGTRYSSRADNAVACVANDDPNEFIDAIAVLYEHQPKEGSDGRTNAQILGYLKKAGASSAAITKCVDSDQFDLWVTATTAEVESGTFKGVATTPSAFQGTPTVYVNGQPYTGSLTDASTFTAFVNAEAGS